MFLFFFYKGKVANSRRLVNFVFKTYQVWAYICFRRMKQLGNLPLFLTSIIRYSCPNYLRTPEERSKVYFPRISKRKFQWVKRGWSDNHAEKQCQVNIYFCFFQKSWLFSEENSCFINSQSLTACPKQTRQVIKISRHGFLKKTCQENIAMLISSSCSNPTRNDLD